MHHISTTIKSTGDKKIFLLQVDDFALRRLKQNILQKKKASLIAAYEYR